MRRRRLWPLGMAGGIVLLSIGGFSGPASAEAPSLQGWWASTNPGGLPVDPPAPPDVAADGLLVQAGATGPSAYAALTYDFDSGATPETLTLRLTSTAPPVAAPTLVLCALKVASFSQQHGGPMSDAPAYDCGRTASATLDGSSFTFKVAGLAEDGSLAVAVLPGDATTRAVLAAPGEDSLTLAGGTATTPVTSVPDSGPPPAAAAPDLPGMTGAVSAPTLSAGGSAVPPAQVASGSGQAPAVADAAAPASVPLTTRQVASTTPTGSARRVLVVLLVAALACFGVVWAFTGSAAPVQPTS